MNSAMILAPYTKEGKTEREKQETKKETHKEEKTQNIADK
jgi:hypothetical protein